MMLSTSYDYIIVGSGIAGLYAALLARQHGTVLLLTKGAIDDANTKFAQGGIAAAVGEGDSPALHLQDTIAAGAGLVDEAAARILVEEAPARIADLVRFGVPFDTLHGELALGREAAHSRARILHAGGDRTGEHMELSLAILARKSRITVLEHTMVERLLIDGDRAVGAVAMRTDGGERIDFFAVNIILATGGAGQLYRVTTNPPVATGDGIALAYEAGAELMDMEFIQFHPTALRMPGVPPFLISEAVRGEGAILRADGRAFMSDYDSRAELAPRDVVARSIVSEMQKIGADHVDLDVTHLQAAHVTARFPQIYRYCLEHGLDITIQPIPVAPAAHYIMGGVRTDTWGRSTVRGLYVCGEAACTGVHGANRLASNSLLETVVFAGRAVEATLGGTATPWLAPVASPMDVEPAWVEEAPQPSLADLQSLMWQYAGIERSGAGLEQARATLARYAGTLPAAVDRPSLELNNLVCVARLVVEAALLRTESRGAHYRSDYPAMDPSWRRHIILRKGGAVRG